MSEPENDLPLLEEKNFTLSEEANLSYIFWSGAKKLTIVFIHGLGSNKYDFLDAFNFEELVYYNLVLVDLVGHGNSKAPDTFTYSMKDQAEALLKLLECLEISEDIIIVAHSMGGPIGIHLAELLGNRSVGIVYAEGNLDEGDCFLSNEVVTKFTFDEWLETGFETYLEIFSKDPLSKRYTNAFKKAGPITTYNSSVDLVKISKGDELLAKLKALSIPVLAVFGEKNKGKFTSEEKLSAAFPLMYISDADHDMMYQNPKKFYESLIDFLSQY